MASFDYPGVFTIEKDNSQYAPTVDSSIVGMLGFASKGPTDVATLITSPQSLLRIFGEPSEDIRGQALEGSLEILEATNRLYFVRASGETAAAASATMPFGACPSVQVSANDYGVTGGNALYLAVQVTDNAGVAKYPAPKKFAVPIGTSDTSQLNALRAVMGGNVESSYISVEGTTSNADNGYIVGRYAGKSATLSVSAYSDATYETGVTALQVVDADGDANTTAVSSATVYGVTLDTTSASGLSYQVESLFEGAGYNAGTKADGSVSGNSSEVDNLNSLYSVLTVNDQGAAYETFQHSLVASKNFIEDVINTGSVNVTSEVIKGNLFASGADFDATPLTDYSDQVTALGLAAGVSGITNTTEGRYTPRFVKLLDGTQNLAGGDNGITNDDDDIANLIGSVENGVKTGMQVLDEDYLNISMALCPAINDQRLQNELISLAESSQNFVALVAPPYAVGSVQNAVEWSNGESDTRTAAINSSYAAIHWPWLEVFSVADGKNIWMDPSIYGARQMVYTDSVAEAWFAPAGERRGRLTKPVDTEIPLNSGDVQTLYSGGNVINPITKFAQTGIVIWGQRTAQRIASALDRINVRRLMIVLRKQLLQIGRPFVMEPNDEFTWDLIKNVVNPTLDDYQRRRAITAFKVTCDETINTPVRVDRNELWCQIAIKPTKTAEAIIFELNLTSQNAKLGS